MDPLAQERDGEGDSPPASLFPRPSPPPPPPSPGDLPLRDKGGEVKASGWQRACHCYVSSTD